MLFFLLLAEKGDNARSHGGHSVWSVSDFFPVDADADALSTHHQRLSVSAKQRLHTRQSHLFSAAVAAVGSDKVDVSSSVEESRWDRVRREGGMFSIHTKHTVFLNPFGLWYGAVAVTLGIPWYIAMTICQIFYKLTGERFD